MLAMCSSSVTSTPGNTLEKGEIAAASTTASTRGGTPLRVLVAGVAVLCQVEHGSTARNEGQAERVVKRVCHNFSSDKSHAILEGVFHEPAHKS